MTGGSSPAAKDRLRATDCENRATARTSHADADADSSREIAQRDCGVRATVDLHHARWLLIVPPSSRALTAQERGSSAAMGVDPSDQGRQAVAVGNAISRLHREHYGRGATTVRTVIQRGYVVAFLNDIYTPV